MGKKLTLEEFIRRSQEIHKEEDGSPKYGYDLVEYKGSKVKVPIRCKKHKIFNQIPNDHLLGRGCPKCGKDKIAELYKDTLEEFISKAVMVHGDKYDYSRVKYAGSQIKVEIICNNHEHPSFEVTPNSHLSQQVGCPACSKKESFDLIRKLAVKSFLKKAVNKYGNKYTFPDLNYIDHLTPINIYCTSHEILFKQKPYNFLCSNDPCPLCRNEKLSMTNTKSLSMFIKQAKAIHNEKYEYGYVEYVNTYTPVKIFCFKCNDFFYQTPNRHLKGCDCPTCAVYGFKAELPAILYYLKINNGQAYKIGITNRTVKERFDRDREKIKVLKTWAFDTGRDAKLMEKGILEEYKDFKYKGLPLLEGGGNTELFSKDILNLDVMELDSERIN